MKNKIIVGLIFACFINLLKSQDYWKPIVSGTKSNLYSVSFGDAQTGYICGSDSLLLKTTNGGKTWNRLIFKGITFKTGGYDLVDVKFVSPAVGYMIQSNHKNPVYQGVLYKTIDGGQNWLPNSNVNIAPWKIFYFNEDNGYQVGSAYYQGKMVGKQVKGNWQNVHSFSWNANEFVSAIDFYDTLTGIIGGDSGFVHRTFDGGVTWDTVKVNKGHTIFCLKYLSEKIVMAGMGGREFESKITYSHDAGKTWVEEQADSFSFPFYKQVNAILKSKRDSIILVGFTSFHTWGVPLIVDGFIERLVGPDSFQSQYTKYPMNAATMKNDSIAFVVGNSGLILCNGFFETISFYKVKLVRAGVSPNPVSKILTIKYPSDFDFKLYASDGKFVVSGSNCTTAFQLDVSVFSAGIYNLQILYKDHTSEMHKIVVE